MSKHQIIHNICQHKSMIPIIAQQYALIGKSYYTTTMHNNNVSHYVTNKSETEIMMWYRKLMKRALFIPNEGKRNQIIQQIKQEFRKEFKAEWLTKCQEGFQFLSMITPKAPSKQISNTPIVADGVVKYIKVDGEWIDMKSVDPEKLQKKDVAYMKGGSEDSFSRSPSSCPPGGCGKCQLN